MAKKEKMDDKDEVKKVEPAHSLSRFEEMERQFEHLFPHAWMRPLHMDWPAFNKMNVFEGKTPKVDVIDRDKVIVVKAELPGVAKKDIDVSVTNNTVTIKGTTRHEEKEEKGDFYRSEISRGSYSRTLSLPSDVDEKNTRAKIKDGILELTLKKLRKSNRHSVKID